MAKAKSICPSGERLFVSYYTESGVLKFILTSKKDNRNNYYLYSVDENNNVTKLGRAKTPPELERKFKVYESLKEKKKRGGK